MSDQVIVGFPKQGAEFTITGSTFSASYPITNVLDTTYAKVARSVGLSGVTITGTTQYWTSLRMFGIAAHNMTLEATYRLRLYDDTNSPTILLYDSGVQLVWDAVYDFNRPLETDNWFTNQYGTDEVAGQIPFCPILLDQDYSVTRWVLELFDADNPAGHIDIGYLEVTTGWELSVNPETPADYGYKSFTRVNDIDGGLKRFEVFAPSYTFEGRIPFMDRVEVQQQAMELFRQYGLHTPFMWMPHPNNKEQWLRNCKMVTLADLGLFSYVVNGTGAEGDIGFDSVPLKLEEYKG